MPSRAEIHIQKIAPAPPKAIALPIAIIFPVPTVAPSAAVRVLKGETFFPSASGCFVRSVRFIIVGKCSICKPFVLIVKIIPEPANSISTGMPHTIFSFIHSNISILTCSFSSSTDVGACTFYILIVFPNITDYDGKASHYDIISSFQGNFRLKIVYKKSKI